MPVMCVTGGQKFTDRDLLFRSLDQIRNDWDWSITELRHGDCPTGADKFADEWAAERGVPVRKFPAAWNAYGRAAGIIRNSVMADTMPDMVVAFEGANGTRDMIKQAKRRHIHLIIIGDWYHALRNSRPTSSNILNAATLMR